MNIKELNADPSFGSHFFHNLTNLRIGYLTQDKRNKTLDLDWIDSCNVKEETNYLKWIALEKPLTIQIDGSSGQSIILKYPIEIDEIIDEDESSGI